MKPSGQRPFCLTVLAFSTGYASYLVSKILFVVVIFPLFICVAFWSHAKEFVFEKIVRRYLAFFTRTWLPFLGVYRFEEISGLSQALAAGPAVCVANHRGFMDGIILLGLLPRTGVLIKSRDTRQPMYRLLAAYFDLVSLDRRSLASMAASLEKCRNLISQRKNLLVFPEGLRAHSGRLQRFHRVAFDLALSEGVPIMPIIIHSTQPFLAKLPGSIYPRQRNTYRIRFLAPERPKPGEDASAFSDRIYRRMAQELKPLDVNTVWQIHD